jgi:hypothetical protein
MMLSLDECLYQIIVKFAVAPTLIEAHDAVRPELFGDGDAGSADVKKTHGALLLTTIPWRLARLQAATA